MDLHHQWGSDLTLTSTGDLSTVHDAPLGQQRVLRRLLTSPSDYVWHPQYGAGLGALVGQPLASNQIEATARAHMFREAAVEHAPEPQIQVARPEGSRGTSASVRIVYVDSSSREPQLLQFPVPGELA